MNDKEFVLITKGKPITITLPVGTKKFTVINGEGNDVTIELNSPDSGTTIDGTYPKMEPTKGKVISDGTDNHYYDEEDKEITGMQWLELNGMKK